MCIAGFPRLAGAPFAFLLAATPLVNEFVARAGGGTGEWIEILNPGPEAVALDGWGVRDATGRLRLLAGAPLVGAGGYLVLADRPDSVRAAHAVPESVAVLRPAGWPALNDNDAAGGGPADVIVLVDPAGGVADSVAYRASWLPAERGRSVERAEPDLDATDPGSWGWSVDPGGATPGRANSLSGGPGGEDRGALSGPDVVHPGAGPEIFIYRFGEPGILALVLLDREGRTAAVLRPPEPSPAAGAWVWTGSAPLPPRSGPYFLCAAWQAIESGRALRTCRSVWVER